MSKLDNKKKLYVGNLSYDTTLDALKAKFSEFGEVVDAIIITDRNTGRSKGFGFVEYADEESAEKAVKAMSGKELDERTLVVNVARPSREQ